MELDHNVFSLNLRCFSGNKPVVFCRHGFIWTAFLSAQESSKVIPELFCFVRKSLWLGLQFIRQPLDNDRILDQISIDDFYIFFKLFNLLILILV